jgi:hypothetical protein
MWIVNTLITQLERCIRHFKVVLAKTWGRGSGKMRKNENIGYFLNVY